MELVKKLESNIKGNKEISIHREQIKILDKKIERLKIKTVFLYKEKILKEVNKCLDEFKYLIKLREEIQIKVVSRECNLCYQGLKSLEDLMFNYNEITKSNSSEFITLFQIGLFYEKMKMLDKSKEISKKIIELEYRNYNQIFDYLKEYQKLFNFYNKGTILHSKIIKEALSFNFEKYNKALINENEISKLINKFKDRGSFYISFLQVCDFYQLSTKTLIETKKIFKSFSKETEAFQRALKKENCKKCEVVEKRIEINILVTQNNLFQVKGNRIFQVNGSEKLSSPKRKRLENNSYFAEQEKKRRKVDNIEKILNKENKHKNFDGLKFMENNTRYIQHINRTKSTKVSIADLLN